MAHRTLWQEGRHPGGLVVLGVAVVLCTAVALDLAISTDLGWLFDVALVLACGAAAILVRPRDIFTAGVLPPLALGATILVLAVTDRDAVARPTDGLVQATVSGLAHHAIALALAYALTLALLALRQVALRHDGRLRATDHPAPRFEAPADEAERLASSS